MQGNGTLNTTLLLWAFNLSQSIANGDYGPNKALWIKAWVGPGDEPMSGSGLTHGPSWPVLYGKTPNTTTEIQEAATRLLKYPLAIYLCGIYNKYTYFAYSWFWGVDDGWIPCPDDPKSCDCPSNWYQEFMNKFGEPKSNGIMTDTFKCNRSFEYADVYVDIRDNIIHLRLFNFHSCKFLIFGINIYIIFYIYFWVQIPNEEMIKIII